MAYVTVNIDVEDIDWEEIVTHIEECGYCVIDKKDIQRIYEARSFGSQERANKLIDELVYNTIGKTV